MADLASGDILALLHKMTAEHMLARLQSGEITAAELNVIRQFIKDNGISAAMTDDSPISHIVDELPTFDDDKVVSFGRPRD